MTTGNITGPILGAGASDTAAAVVSVNNVLGSTLLYRCSCSTTTIIAIPNIFSSSYRNYTLDITNVAGVSVANNTLQFQFGTGASLTATSIYTGRQWKDTATAVSATQTVSAGAWPLITNINCSSSGGANGEFRIKNPNRAGLKSIAGEAVIVSSVSLITTQEFKGAITDTAANFTDANISWGTTDNFASGELRIYGWK